MKDVGKIYYEIKRPDDHKDLHSEIATIIECQAGVRYLQLELDDTEFEEFKKRDDKPIEIGSFDYDNNSINVLTYDMFIGINHYVENNQGIYKKDFINKINKIKSGTEAMYYVMEKNKLHLFVIDNKTKSVTPLFPDPTINSLSKGEYNQTIEVANQLRNNPNIVFKFKVKFAKGTKVNFYCFANNKNCEDRDFEPNGAPGNVKTLKTKPISFDNFTKTYNELSFRSFTESEDSLHCVNFNPITALKNHEIDATKPHDCSPNDKLASSPDNVVHFDECKDKLTPSFKKDIDIFIKHKNNLHVIGYASNQRCTDRASKDKDISCFNKQIAKQRAEAVRDYIEQVTRKKVDSSFICTSFENKTDVEIIKSKDITEEVRKQMCPNGKLMLTEEIKETCK
ncbi:MAG: hypothetical protein HQK92_02385 [Nitrospirae bacterium]|nr:hypothetical protein [Nitrospirota bacterium]